MASLEEPALAPAPAPAQGAPKASMSNTYVCSTIQSEIPFCDVLRALNKGGYKIKYDKEGMLVKSRYVDVNGVENDAFYLEDWTVRVVDKYGYIPNKIDMDYVDNCIYQNKATEDLRVASWMYQGDEELAEKHLCTVKGKNVWTVRRVIATTP